ncbi:MOSC domain-containing protein [Paraburkholderia sp. BCC1885]|uniref:MOSC domain-containing protein n=1 Tax=Paraburkholderia sp. BCC1885 TaxID=2562669 RepID=UPI0011829B44|nr:MOSC domain-containing protein [Paraburkholderia sp. BCC1885]
MDTVLREIRIGKIARLGSSDILSGMAKSPCVGTVHIARERIADDEYGAPHLHGGVEQVILQYPEEHYALWRDEFPQSAERFCAGGFGENFVATGFNESNICIGDVVEVGEARLQVSMPRQPCFRLNHRFDQPGMAQRVQQTRRTGWYYRVLRPGNVQAGDTLRVVERPHRDWTISWIQHFLYVETGNRDAMAEIVALDALAPLIRDLFRKRLQSPGVEDWSSRLVESSATPSSSAETTSADDGWMRLRVRSVTLESSRVRSFILAPEKGSRLPVSQPGAHVRLKLPNGLERQYSLCENSDGRYYKIAVALDQNSRGGSRWMHTEPGLGDILLVSPPSNSFSVVPDADHHLMIAGGIGITPFLSMIQHFRAIGARFRLVYLGRSETDAPFVEELGNLRASEVRFHFNDGDATRRFDLQGLLESLDESTHVYCCGPNALMDAVRHAKTKLPASHFHFEAFASTAEPGSAQPFIAHLAKSGRSIAAPANQTLLEALRKNGVEVPSSCETGSCGTCVIGYSKGRVEHNDICLHQSSRDSLLAVCVSRATSGEITLDL